MPALATIRWTQQKASTEFGIHANTLAMRLKRGGILPGEDGKYSTKQICVAMFGDIEAETLRKLTEDADKVALQNEKTRGSLVEIESVYRHFEHIFVSLRARILASGLMPEEKDEILNDLRKLKARDFTDSDGGSDDNKPFVRHPDPAATA